MRLLHGAAGRQARERLLSVLVVVKDGASVATGEGLAEPNGALHPMQAAFVEHDVFRCGRCTPGLGGIGIVGTAAAIADATHHATGKRIREMPITIDEVLG